MQKERKLTLKEFNVSYRGDLPYDVKFLIVDRWSIRDFVLLLRTQPEMPHKLWHRNNTIEKTFNLHKNSKDRDFNVVRNGYLAQLSNCNESKWAMDILKSRIVVGKIVLDEKEKKMLYKYFDLVEKWIKKIREQTTFFTGEIF